MEEPLQEGTNMLILSVIIPIYGVEKYLRKCVDSVLAQDIASEEYEIILVDDGSPDKCGEIADDYANKHPNIKVLHQNNRGLSAARNAGLKIALGTYIQFVDSDDYLEPNVLNSAINKLISDDLEILRFNYQNVNEDYIIYLPYKRSQKLADYHDSVCDGITFLCERLGHSCYVTQFIIKRSVIIDNSLFFKEGILYEDVDWTPRLLMVTKRITSINTIIYNYLLRKGSITSSTEHNNRKKSLTDKLALIETLNHKSSDNYVGEWHRSMIAAIVLSMVSTICADFYKDKNYYLSLMKAKMIFPLSPHKTTFRNSIKIILLNIFPKLYFKILHIKIK